MCVLLLLMRRMYIKQSVTVYGLLLLLLYHAVNTVVSCSAADASAVRIMLLRYICTQAFLRLHMYCRYAVACCYAATAAMLHVCRMSRRGLL